MSVFNTEKTAADYGESPLFFGTAPGLFDTINKVYPEIWDLYKEMKKLAWSEDEFDYSQCNIDFKTVHRPTAEKMKKTLIYQWEQDSVAARAIAPVLAPFITNSELWAMYQRISDNEVIHAATYSEIVRMSFDDPKSVLVETLEMKETIQRMEVIIGIMNDLAVASHKYALGLIPADQELFNKLYLFIVALFIMERVQFMASFGVTFTICASGPFQPIGQAVKKIAQDELEVHVQAGKAVLRILHNTEMGRIAREQTKEIVEAMFVSVINSEFAFIDWLFSDGEPMVGTNADFLKKWVLFCGKDPVTFLGLNHPFGKLPKENPMPHLEKWIDMNKLQAAPMEQDHGQYKVGVVVDDSSGEDFSDFA